MLLLMLACRHPVPAPPPGPPAAEAVSAQVQPTFDDAGDGPPSVGFEEPSHHDALLPLPLEVSPIGAREDLWGGDGEGLPLLRSLVLELSLVNASDRPIELRKVRWIGRWSDVDGEHTLYNSSDIGPRALAPGQDATLEITRALADERAGERLEVEGVLIWGLTGGPDLRTPFAGVVPVRRD